MILNKRIWRDFRENFIRNAAMVFIIAMSMSLVVALCSTTECINATIRREWELCNVEDGSFETYIPLSERNFNDLSELNVQIEEMFYSDIPVNDVSTLRIFKNRKMIDLAYPETGRLPQNDNEIFLEKIYAANHNLAAGSEMQIGGETYYVSGVGCLPDYGYVKQNSSDVAANEEFSVAVVNDKAFKKLRGTNKIIYNYAYTLGNGCTVKDLQKKLTKLEFDTNAVKDTYIKGQLEKASGVKKAFSGTADSLSQGAGTLADGLQKLDEALSDAGIDDSGADKLYEGAVGLHRGIEGMKDGFSGYFEDGGYDIVNLSSFREAQYNIRVTDAIDDSQIGKQSALVIGVFLLILLTYMLSIFASGTIEKERGVIGTLYALGYGKREILSHYMMMPMIVAVAGAVLGAVCGFLLTDTMSSSYTAMYSFPDIIHVIPLYLPAYAIGMPTVFSFLINGYVLNKKLNTTPLKMMHETHSGGGFGFKLGNMSFARKYKIRQFFRELRGNLTLFAGIIVSVLLIMFSVACYGSISKYINGITKDINYNYMYILRNPVSDLPPNSEIGYTRGFYVDYSMTGKEMEVTLQGIGSDNPYFDFAPQLSNDEDKIYMSDSARIKFGYKVGDKVIFHDNAEDKLYAFEIAGEVKCSSGLYFFMNLDAMRKAFGLPYFDEENLDFGEKAPKPETYYYNTVFSDKKLEFKHNMSVSEVSKDEMYLGASKFMTLMWGMILLMIGVSMFIFIAVMYLLMKLEIDRSSFSVSLLKALGYREETVDAFYLDGSFYITLASIVFGIPICKLVINKAYPFCVSNVNAGFEAAISPFQYGIIIAIILITYFAARLLLERYLRKIKLTEILKNRE